MKKSILFFISLLANQTESFSTNYRTSNFLGTLDWNDISAWEYLNDGTYVPLTPSEGPPVAGDVVLIQVGDIINVSSNVACTGIRINGTLTLNNYTFTVSNAFINSGVFNGAGSTVIFNGLTTITGTSTSVFNNVTINNNKTLTAHAGSMEFQGNWINNGIFNHNSASVKISGTGTQNIGGSSISVFYNLNKNNSGIAILSNSVTVNNNLSISSGIFNAGNYSLNGTGNLVLSGGNLCISKTGVTVPELTGMPYSITSGVLKLNGNGNQTLRAGTYYNLIVDSLSSTLLGGNLILLGNLTINKNTSSLSLNGSNNIVLHGNWRNNGSFSPQTGIIDMVGNVLQTIDGSSISTFNTLLVDNSGPGIIINQHVMVLNTLFLNNGDVDLNGWDIDLSTTGTLFSETNDKRVKGNSGVIKATRTLNAPNNLNVAGLGAVITSSANMGSTLIKRGHAAQSISGNPGILRYFDMAPTNNTGLNATLKFQYLDNNELNSLPESALTIWTSNDAGSSWTNNFGTTDLAGNKSERTNFDSFSKHTLCNSSSAALPLKLLSFGADYNGYEVKIAWSTTQEVNMEYYEIEKINEDNRVEVIANVNAKGVNSQVTNHYSIVDPFPSSKNYYRLKQVDRMGRVDYSALIAVMVKPISDSKFFPNPVNEGAELTLQFPERTGDLQISIFDLSGREKNRQTVSGSGNLKFTTGLPSGIYSIVISSKEKIYTELLVIR